MPASLSRSLITQPQHCALTERELITVPNDAEAVAVAIVWQLDTTRGATRVFDIIQQGHTSARVEAVPNLVAESSSASLT